MVTIVEGWRITINLCVYIWGFNNPCQQTNSSQWQWLYPFRKTCQPGLTCLHRDVHQFSQQPKKLVWMPWRLVSGKPETVLSEASHHFSCWSIIKHAFLSLLQMKNFHCLPTKKTHTPWKINMEPTNHPFRKENDLPNLHDYVPC